MRHFFTLLLHELRMLLIAPASFVAAVLYLLLMTFVYYFYLNTAASEPTDQTVAVWFFQAFWIPVCFMIPLLTMKSIAEERRLGTLETLMTTPATALQIVLSKFLSSYLFYICLWALTIPFPFIVHYYVGESVPLDLLFSPASMIGGYSFIAISGLLYIAVGIFASSMTRNQLVAGMLSFCILFVMILAGALMVKMPVIDAQWLQQSFDIVNYINSFEHLEDFSRGVLDSRPLFLYGSLTMLLLGITTLVVESKA
ncbi:ABC transporter permease [Cerasicoccus frondis]|uniref:ABC transporter permease n=1 Tax=Cerasicoccus frondis TaxID=490090 RepID=UPI0028526B84|nr:ABC transporter permease [Cerasicoccus frondis]